MSESTRTLSDHTPPPHTPPKARENSIYGQKFHFFSCRNTVDGFFFFDILQPPNHRKSLIQGFSSIFCFFRDCQFHAANHAHSLGRHSCPFHASALASPHALFPKLNTLHLTPMNYMALLTPHVLRLPAMARAVPLCSP